MCKSPSVVVQASCLFLQFYFGDRNLPRDKFMQQTIASNEGGCIL